MKKIAVITLGVIILFLAGCKPREYTFPNKNQAVEKIELLYNPYTDSSIGSRQMEIVCTLEDESVDAFLERLYGLDTGRCTTPLPRNYGVYIARVIYQNGDVEMFGSRHIEFIKKGDRPKAVGAYFFSGEEFEKLFFEYAEISDFQE